MALNSKGFPLYSSGSSDPSNPPGPSPSGPGQGPVSLPAAPLSPARDRRFPGIPAWPYGLEFAAALGQSLPPPALWLPEGHLAKIQINCVLASTGEPLIHHKTALD